MKFFKGLMPFFMQQKNNKKIGAFKKKIYSQELLAVLCIAFVLFLSIAVFSFDAQDNSLFFYASNRFYIANLGGRLGAELSAFLFFLWGNAVYFFVAALWGFVSVLVFARFFSFERVAAFMLMPCIAASLLEAFQKSFFVLEPALQQAVVGGFVGAKLWVMFEHALGIGGGFVFLFSLLWICLLWLANYSLFNVFVAGVTMAGRALLFFSHQSFIALQWLYGTKIMQAVCSLREMSWRALDIGDEKKESLLFMAATMGRDEDAKVHKEHALWDDLLQLCTKSVNAMQEGSGADQKNGVTQTVLQDFATTSKSLFSFDVFKVYKPRLGATAITFARWNLIKMRNACIDFTKRIDLLNASMMRVYDGATSATTINSAQKAAASIKKQSLFKLPSIQLLELKKEPRKDRSFFEKELAERGVALTQKLQHFGIAGKVTAIRPGPVITCFEYAPEADSKISKITSLEDDLAMALSALSIRIVAPIPGRNVIGFEIANEQRSSVYLKEIAHSPVFEKTTARLPLMLGVDTTGSSVVCDLVTMPHLLVAGSTGSGKSVGMHAMLMSLLFSKTPEELKFVLIDPKRLEFVAYADIPHLLFPIVTQPNLAAPILAWIVREMERRYECLARCGVRNVFDYHALQKKSELATEQAMPFIVVMIDELADLMMVAGKEVEMNIARIAQMARAAGIYMIIATQRPSVDVVTGLIKANFPSRIAFRVASKIDSRTILDASGAEKLLGAGDMLFMHSASSNLTRIHGAYVSEAEVLALTQCLKAQQEPSYISLDEVLKKDGSSGLSVDEEDDLYEEVSAFVQTMEEISISMLQRHYRIGFNRSARLIKKLETMGIIAPAQGSKPRKVMR